MSNTVNPALEGQPEKLAEGWPTLLRESQGEDWLVIGHTWRTPIRKCDHEDAELATLKLRRVGWLDQKGRVWVVQPTTREFDGGSLTPLLIDPGCK
jgi:hypothetical protein